MCLLDEGCLPRGVLTHQHHQRLPVKVRVLELGRVELVEVVLLLQRQEVLRVHLLQPGGHILPIELSTNFRESFHNIRRKLILGHSPCYKCHLESIE